MGWNAKVNVMIVMHIYFLIKLRIKGVGDDAAPRHANERNIRVKFKSCPPLTNYIRKINNNQVDNAKDPDVAICSTKKMLLKNTWKFLALSQR